MGNTVGLINSLAEAMQRIQQNPYPHVPNPADCQKRASVALVLRIRPQYADGVAFADRACDPVASLHLRSRTLADFFAQSWVQNGDPEILFIKRAGRAGDRWSGHVALPGGKRDPPDASDWTAAIRETKEEVGLDLAGAGCLYAGNLPERVVTTTWGAKGLMVLCPFVFVLTSPLSPSLLPQPTEVAATHWVPLRALLSASVRTRELVDVSSRFAKRGGPLIRAALRILLGKMEFSAVRLIPSESVFATSIHGFISDASQKATLFTRGSFGVPSSSAQSGPLLLWGLTLGVLADLLEMLPPHDAIKLWQYPTFTTLDLRFLIYLFTYKLRKNNAQHLNAGTWPGQPAVDTSTAAVPVSQADGPQSNSNQVGVEGLGVGRRETHALSLMLSGYYERMNVAIAVFLCVRIAAASALGYFTFRAWKTQRR